MTSHLTLSAATTTALLLALGTASAGVESLRIHWSELRPADQQAGMVVMPSNAATTLPKGETLSKVSRASGSN